ncbi:isopentenyl-diphosphate Delta-isomerase [Palleronia caenipelagi]|uniref:Isopentenyl-diphosphate Delta-isomerase n=1 Tax=Palleronia caenipelagi TaxID=2489174 RepID=A0A547Q7L7_9RHOB|nr:isopentenyl-diphosphate Delta-isomerase [Palleronia caenipelagi]TRD22387.1 isopentenyl-diphosphate Delta-isomerase [Palleronia caenipelagi]
MTETLIPAWVDGELTPVEKLEVHQRGLRHQAISVFVMRDGKVLMQRRALGKYHTPGLWANTCCTHPHWGEPSETCALRRLGEELGLSGIPLTPRGTVEYRADVGGGLIEHEVVDLFIGEAPAGMEPNPNADEVCDTAWMAPDDLTRDVAEQPDRYVPWLKIYLRDHADRILDTVGAS